MRFNSPTVAGAALAFIQSGSNMTSFPFNLTRTNVGQAPRQGGHYESPPFFFNPDDPMELSLTLSDARFQKLRRSLYGSRRFLRGVKIDVHPRPIMNGPDDGFRSCLIALLGIQVIVAP
jgi:hypothetical protein